MEEIVAGELRSAGEAEARRSNGEGFTAAEPPRCSRTTFESSEPGGLREGIDAVGVDEADGDCWRIGGRPGG